jgi:hypothetical protein
MKRHLVLYQIIIIILFHFAHTKNISTSVEEYEDVEDDNDYSDIDFNKPLTLEELAKFHSENSEYMNDEHNNNDDKYNHNYRANDATQIQSIDFDYNYELPNDIRALQYDLHLTLTIDNSTDDYHNNISVYSNLTNTKNTSYIPNYRVKHAIPVLSITGSTRIAVETIHTTNTITLHFGPNTTLISYSLQCDMLTRLSIVSMERNTTRHTLTLTLSQKVRAHTHIHTHTHM